MFERTVFLFYRPLIQDYWTDLTCSFFLITVALTSPITFIWRTGVRDLAALAVRVQTGASWIPLTSTLPSHCESTAAAKLTKNPKGVSRDRVWFVLSGWLWKHGSATWRTLCPSVDIFRSVRKWESLRQTGRCPRSRLSVQPYARCWNRGAVLVHTLYLSVHFELWNTWGCFNYLFKYYSKLLGNPLITDLIQNDFWVRHF